MDFLKIRYFMGRNSLKRLSGFFTGCKEKKRAGNLSLFVLI
jgi:hypothetical protein